MIDAIALATGYRAALPPGVTVPDEVAGGGRTSPASGLHFCGFFVSPTGRLQEIGIEARAIVAAIAAERSSAGSWA